MIGGKKTLLSDADEQLLRDTEREVFNAEVKIAKEPKLFILLAHLYIEHMLERGLNCKLTRTNGLMGKGGLSFEKKALLAEAVQAVPPEVIVSVLLLNKLRNNCAHTFKFQPTEKEYETFLKSFNWYPGYEKVAAMGNSEERFRTLVISMCGVLTGLAIALELHREGKIAPSTKR